MPHRADELNAYLKRFLAHYEAEPVRLTRAYAGVPETLAVLRAAGYRCAVCTNKPQRATDMILDALGLAPYFGAILGADAVQNRKPHPDHLAAALTADRRTTTCVIKSFVRGGLGHLEGFGELPVLRDLEDSFVAGGHRVQGLLVDLVASPLFRAVAEPK